MIAGESAPSESDRYRFLLAMLIDRGVLRQHDRIRQPDGTLGNGWILHGIYGVDDSGDYRGWSHLGPEDAIDSAIIATRTVGEAIARTRRDA